jgi:hypothetical protein
MAGVMAGTKKMASRPGSVSGTTVYMGRRGLTKLRSAESTTRQLVALKVGHEEIRTEAARISSVSFRGIVKRVEEAAHQPL